MTRVLYFQRAATSVDPETEVIAGTLLTGGGPLSSDVTLNVDTALLDERIRDVIGAAITAGSNVTVTVNDAGDTITIAASSGLDAEAVRDTIGAALVAGSNVTITVNDGADTITIAATGGSSSGADPLPLDVPPTSAHAKDDEFSGSSLDGKWTSPLTSNSGNTVTNTVANKQLVMVPNVSGKRAFGIRQASPSGSFTVMAKLVSGNISGSDLRMGLYVGAAGGRGHIVGPFKQDGQVAYIGVSTLSNTADWSAYDGTLTGFGSGVSSVILATWVRIKWDAGTSTMTFYWSQDGVKWKTGTSRGSMAQPDQMGLVIYFNGAGGPSADEFLACDWFRVTEP